MLGASEVRFGEWLPAQPDYANPGCVVARNVIPTPGGYGPLGAPVAQPGTVTGAVRGSRLLFATDGSTVTVGGTATTLFTVKAGTVAATTGLSDVGTGRWDFAQFNDFVIATSLANDPQYLDDIDTDTTWSALPGSPPRASVCARVEAFLMLGDVAGVPNRIQWSAVNAPTASWAASRQTQAGSADLTSAFGRVQRIVGGRYPLVFQARGVQRLEYVGPPEVWSASEVEQGRGAVAPYSVVTAGFLTYYLAQDGFYVTDGASAQPIGDARVNEWFFREADEAAIDTVEAAVDWDNRCVVWAFRSAASASYDRLLIYSYAENRWSHAAVTIDALASAQLGEITLDQIGDLYPTLEDVPGSLDDARWQARNRVLAAWRFDGTNSLLSTFSGDPLQADFETGELQPAPGRRSFVSGARVLARGAPAASVATISYTNARDEEIGAFAGAGADGFCPLRSDGMTHRLAVRFPAGAAWRDAQGVQARFRVSGAR